MRLTEPRVKHAFMSARRPNDCAERIYGPMSESENGQAFTNGEPVIRTRTSELPNLVQIVSDDESFVCDPETGACLVPTASQEQLAAASNDGDVRMITRDELITNDFQMDPTRWRTGLALSEFIAGMDHNQAAMRRRLAEVKLTPDDRRYFNQTDQPIHVSVMTDI